MNNLSKKKKKALLIVAGIVLAGIISTAAIVIPRNLTNAYWNNRNKTDFTYIPTEIENELFQRVYLPDEHLLPADKLAELFALPEEEREDSEVYKYLTNLFFYEVYYPLNHPDEEPQCYTEEDLYKDISKGQNSWTSDICSLRPDSLVFHWLDAYTTKIHGQKTSMKDIISYSYHSDGRASKGLTLIIREENIDYYAWWGDGQINISKEVNCNYHLIFPYASVDTNVFLQFYNAHNGGETSAFPFTVDNLRIYDFYLSNKRSFEGAGLLPMLSS